jgi:hypothetical protein
MYSIIKPETATPYKYVVGYCCLPYAGHPEGCENLGALFRSLRGIRKDLRPRVIRECPRATDPDNPDKPQIEFLEDMIMDYSRDLYAVWIAFPLGQDADRRMNDPDTKLHTLKQFYNPRYWQDMGRSMLYRQVEGFLDTYPETMVDLCPEAHGVRLNVLMQKAMNIRLDFKDWPVKEHSIDMVKYMVCLGGYPKDRELLIRKGLLGRLK